MTEPIEEHVQPAEAPAVARTVGQAFSSAREQAGLSLEQVAASLRLSVRQVQALESDDAAALPSPTFVRGFIRNYAKLLNLDVDSLLEIYRVYAPTATPGNISLHSENIPILKHDKKAWLPYAMASGLVALALAGWLAFMEFRQQAADEASPPAAVAEPELTEEALPLATPIPLPEQAAVPMAVSGVEPAAEPVTPVVAVPAPAKLVIRFTGQSWVSVTDRDGKELFNKNESAGAQSVVEGTPPFSLIVGNASAVQIQFNDKPVDLALHTKANVARLTLE